VAVVTKDPGERGRLIRLRIGDLVGCLRGVLAPDTWQGPHLVLDHAIATAVGVPDYGDSTEAAVRVRAGRIVARAQGRGAAHAVATAGRR
jgi:hypothetical protein